LDELAAGKPRIVILNRSDQADPVAAKLWKEYFFKRGMTALLTDSKSGAGVEKVPAAIKTILRDRINKYEEKGQSGRTLKVMVAGVPNVGKSSLINRLTRRKVAKAEDRPGVTRGKQWVQIDSGIELLDTPGILWPKFEDERVGMYLAFTGAVKDEVIDIETLAFSLLDTLKARYRDNIKERYGVEPGINAPGHEILEAIAKKRGFILPGGVADNERAARILLDEFREGKLGRITLELPEAE
jgi:ribosome biogenesis GTPase A